ncbi:hypothetical protein JTB14_011956 [Gonioctena quinquepunctata]|nr:hypothetical protein JTB14_011956 [Gonioctena quinquepunctata]
MKLEIVEEDLIETKPFRDYVVFNKCLEKKEKKRFHDSSEFQVTQSNSVNRKESKLPPTDFWENKDFNQTFHVNFLKTLEHGLNKIWKRMEQPWKGATTQERNLQ